MDLYVPRSALDKAEVENKKLRSELAQLQAIIDNPHVADSAGGPIYGGPFMRRPSLRMRMNEVLEIWNQRGIKSATWGRAARELANILEERLLEPRKPLWKKCAGIGTDPLAAATACDQCDGDGDEQDTAVTGIILPNPGKP